MPPVDETYRLPTLERNSNETSIAVLSSSDHCVFSPENRKWTIIKNVGVVSFGFLLLFTAFQSVQNLQSSINSEKGLGASSLATIYAALVISCMFVPTYMIRRLGLKYTLITAILMYSVYFVANFYPSFWTMIPASIVLGLGGAPLWTAKCAYLICMATEYAELTGQMVGHVVTRFFGLFFMVFQTGQIWGNLISYYVLRPGMEGEATNVSTENCGIQFSTAEDDAANPNLQPPDVIKRYTLMAVFTASSLLAAFSLLLFLQPLQPKDAGKRPPLTLLVETLRHLRRPYQLLIIPLTMFSGLEQAFLWGDFTQAYVSCSWGIHRVGFVMITFGVADAAFSLVIGAGIRQIGRLVIFLLGASVNVGLIVICFLWVPTSDQAYVLFLIAGFWGIGDAVWQTQVNALYGVLFPDAEEAAFANYRLWESVGFIIAFGTQKLLPIQHKLILLSTFLVLGMTGYLIIEVHSKTKHLSQRIPP